MSDREVSEISEAEGEMRPLGMLPFGVWVFERGRRVAELPRTRLLILAGAVADGRAGRGDAILRWWVVVVGVSSFEESVVADEAEMELAPATQVESYMQYMYPSCSCNER
jgi:hypothetical protein